MSGTKRSECNKKDVEVMMEEENEPALAVSHKGFLKVTSFTGQFIPRSSFTLNSLVNIY